MPAFHRDTLLPLARNHADPSITLYMPTHRSEPEKSTDRIRFKNLTALVCEHLLGRDIRQPDVDHLCAPLHDMLADDGFWRDTSDGVAVFIAPDRVETLKLEGPTPEIAVVGERFYLRPLITTLDRDHRFLALTLSQSGCHLYQGDGNGLEEVELKGAPSSMADELKYDQADPQPSFVSVPGTGAGSVFFGKGGAKDARLSHLERYIKDVQQAVADALDTTHDIPLVLFGVDYEVSYYRLVNTYPWLVEQEVPGATDELKPREIYARAVKALQPYFDNLAERSIDELGPVEGSPLATHDPLHIAQAAAEGRVKTLFFDDDAHPVDETGWDLVDLAAVETVLHGGEVHAFAGENAPMHGVAAVLRW